MFIDDVEDAIEATGCKILSSFLIEVLTPDGEILTFDDWGEAASCLLG